ncbi:MAG: hypothetical protein ACI31D_05265 [Candidatus Limisoma sp.]
MKKLFLLAWPIALAAVSCSNEEVVSVNNDANEIKFTAVANNATRALTDSVYCNNYKPGSFHVWALAKDAETTVVGKSYFKEVLYSANAGKTLWSADQANIRFWPNQGAEKLDFYAMHNYNGTVNWDPANATTTEPRLAVTGYTLTTDVAAQTDFIYAVKQNQVKGGNDGKKTINFRHALSQVVFKARNTNNTLHVEIGEVQVKNFNSVGNFALPLKDTETNLVDHNSDQTTEAADGTVGTWSGQNTLATTKVAVYPTDGAATATYAVVNYDTAGTDATNLTNGSDRVFDKAMLFIPQERTAGTVTESTPGSKNLLNDVTNPYFVVKCKIWNVEGATFNKTTDVCIYDGYAYIPVTVDWKPGKKYIYTFVFGGKNGGYDEDGNDILVPISFTVTVDDFTPVVKEDVNMFQ